jgi:tudor domain-containing protein 1/4/6/7
LEQLEKFYSSLSTNDLHEDQPSLGLPWVARFTDDGRYYRSQILSIVDDIADILFVDYGNQQKTPLSELKRITPCFMKLPRMVILFNLYLKVITSNVLICS